VCFENGEKETDDAFNMDETSESQNDNWNTFQNGMEKLNSYETKNRRRRRTPPRRK